MIRKCRGCELGWHCRSAEEDCNCPRCWRDAAYRTHAEQQADVIRDTGA